MQEYPVGTIEYFVVEVTDRLENVEDLDGYTLTFDVRSRDQILTDDDPDYVWKYEDEPATDDVMKIKCLIDTTDWDLGNYLLWATILATPESPRLGPFEFKIVS